MATTLGRGPKTVKGCEGIAQRPVIDIDRDPRESVTTLAVFFAVAAGYRWGTPKPYLDLVEEMPDGRIERRVHWIFDSESKAEIEGETLTFGEFWERIHHPESSPVTGVLPHLSVAIAILDDMPAEHRSAKLRGWVEGLAGIPPQAKAIFAETATIYDQFLADRMPRFILVQQARGRDTIRCYIPFHATPEERADILARAGIS